MAVLGDSCTMDNVSTGNITVDTENPFFVLAQGGQDLVTEGRAMPTQLMPQSFCRI